MKKIFNVITAVLIGLFVMSATIPTNRVSAGQSDYIVPLFSGYVEDANKATLITQDTVIDMSQYNGIIGVGADAGKITATNSYTISNAQAGATFCIPYMGTMDEVNQMQIIVNGQLVQPECLYGENPFYFAGTQQGFLSITEAVESVQPTTVKDGTAKLYTFEAIGGEIEFSFQKENDQTVIHNGAMWSSQGVNGYSFKGNNSDNEEYPYQIFISNGELIDFKANVEYTVSDIAYKEYVDYYLNEWIAELGEEYRPYYYSKFNRKLSGGVYDVSDVLYDYSAYAFALMKIELPIGNSQIVVNSGVYALVNALYRPYIYTIRTLSPYPQESAYSLTIIPSKNLPYLVEQNIGLKDFSYTSNKQLDDGYYIMGSDKNPDYVLDNNALKQDNTWILYLGIGISCAILLGTAIFLIVSWKKPR